MPLIERLKHLAAQGPGHTPHILQPSSEPEVALRRAVVGASLLGLATVTAAAVIHQRRRPHLPDPQQHFDPAEMTLAEEALGRSEAPATGLSFASHVASMALAVVGGRKRAEEQPWYAVAAFAVAAPAALVSGQYLLNCITRKHKSWNLLGLATAASHLATFGFTLYESGKAVGGLRQWLSSVPSSYRYH